MIMHKISSRRGIFSVLIVFGWLSLGFASTPASEPPQKPTENILDLSIEELMNVEIASTASLTKTKARLVPAAVTTLTKDDIQTSAARSLFELLDIYVPNFQWARNTWEADNMGLRGIIGGDDKYLMLVNGRVMNDRTHFGAVTERDLVLMRDIHHIDVIRGSGSALYGPGALSMVINIVTDNAETFQGTEVSARAGAMEEFSTTEFRYGKKFQDGDGGVYLYGGMGQYPGADNAHAPQKFTYNFPADMRNFWGFQMPLSGLQAGDAAIDPVISRDGAAARGLPPMKLHAEVTRGPWDIWARYTRGGQDIVHDVDAMTGIDNDTGIWHSWGMWVYDPNMPRGFCSYQQATGSVGYNKELTQAVTFTGSFSYDMLDFDRYTIWYTNNAYREDKYNGKAYVKVQINEQQKVALGGEILHGEYGLRGLDWPHMTAQSERFGGNMPRWSTNLYSVLAEHQWTISEQWTTFIGARVDNHTYTDWMFSPRATVAYTPTDKDTLKLMWSRSNRAPIEEELKAQALAGNGTSEPETLSTVEFRFERQQSKSLDLAGSLFVHYDYNLISWSSNGGGNSANIGTQKDYGIELEASYHTDRTRLAFSHSYTKLYEFDLAPGMWTYITAKPFGFGDDLAQWSNHVTKLTATHKLDDQWTVDGSMRIYWGFPGLKDWDTYAHDNAPLDPVDPNTLARYRGNYYLNLGLQYKPSDVLTVGINGYYLLGIFDEDLNKRNSGKSAWRDHAPAVAAYAIYKFR